MDSVLTEVRGQAQQLYKNVNDFLWMFIPLAVALLAFIMGSSVKESLAFSPGSFSFYHLYSSHFVHFTFGHLSSSLIFYAIFVLAAYIIFINIRGRKIFWKSYIIILIAAPLIGSFSWVLASHIYPQLGSLQIYGFSTITSAVIGLFGASIVVYLKTLETEKASTFLSIFTFGVAFVPAIYGYYLPSALLFLLCVLSFIFSTRNSVLEKRHLAIILIWLLLYQIGVQAMFPPEIFYDKFAVNIPSHYAGFSTGIILPMLFSEPKTK